MNTVIQAITRFDRNVFLSVNQSQSAALNKCIGTLTNLGGLAFQTILALGFMAYPPTRFLGLKLAVIQLSLALLVQIIKLLVARVRPYNALAGIVPFKIEKDYSFPSGHTAAAFATALIFSVTFPAGSAFYFTIAMLVGYSRIYIGVHYPSDVIAGSASGLIVATLILAWLF